MKLTGVITTYFLNRKYGFITVGDASYFFHYTQYSGYGVRYPKLGQTVEFELGDPTTLGKPKQAINVMPMEPVETSTVADVLAGVERGK